MEEKLMTSDQYVVSKLLEAEHKNDLLESALQAAKGLLEEDQNVISHLEAKLELLESLVKIDTVYEGHNRVEFDTIYETFNKDLYDKFVELFPELFGDEDD